MSRIADLGEACDKGIETLKDIMDGNSLDPKLGELRLAAARESIHSYFDYSYALKPDTNK